MIRSGHVRVFWIGLRASIPNTRDMQGHLKIYEDFQEVMDQHALSGKMPIRYDFEAPFEVKIYEREEWNHVPTEQSILTYYTDGSKKDDRYGNLCPLRKIL
jgi:hypothetical protein